MKIAPHIILFVLLLLYHQSTGQSDRKKQALMYFEAGRYHDAIIEFNAYKKTEKDPQLLIKRGICYLNTNKADDCIKDMVAAEKLKSLDNNRYKYIALAYMAKYDYVEAAKFFKTYLNTLNSASNPWPEIIDLIKKCGYAVNYKVRPQSAFVENMGQGVNTQYDEFGPVQSPTRPERYYFSSAREGSTGGLRNNEGLSDVLRGHYSADMFMVDLIDGNWSTVLTFGSLMNSTKDDILQDFSQDGVVVYFTKSGHQSNSILYSDTFNVENIPSQVNIESGFPFDAANGDKDLFFFNDSLIVFSSKRDGGKGGYDLYFSELRENAWQAPVNFGSPINTSFNEISPCLIRNGKTLYFSSDQQNTYGGYDIFSATFTQEGNAESIINLGYPINSPGNDTDIEISHDGMFALFASDRIDGYGGKDLYTAYFKDQITGMLETVESPSFVPYYKKGESAELSSATIQPIQKPAIPQRDYLCKPIYYSQDEDVLSNINQNSLKSIADLMLIYPELMVQLYSHSTTEGKKDFDLYFSIKRAEKAAEFLTKSGVSERRIHLIGCGANYPVATPFINNIRSTLADRTNKRIDFNLLNAEQTNLRIMYDFPVVAGQYRDSLWDQFMALNNTLTFRVQFATVVQMLKNEVVNLSNDVLVEKNNSDKVYTYTMGNYLTFDEALRMRNYLRTNGFEKAIIIPVYKGVKTSRLDVIKLSVEFPEVEKYLSSDN